jgi:hypothetical protein
MEFPFGERLRAELGPARHPQQLASSPRSNVWRADVGEAAVVVKQIVGGADAAERYAREVAALELAARVRPPVVPALLGADPGTLTLVLEHLGDAGPAEDWVVAYASGLARLHAAAGPADAGVLPRWRGPDAAPPPLTRPTPHPARVLSSLTSSTTSPLRRDPRRRPR